MLTVDSTSVTITVTSRITSKIPSHQLNKLRKKKRLLSDTMMMSYKNCVRPPMSTMTLAWATRGVLQTQKKTATHMYSDVVAWS